MAKDSFLAMRSLTATRHIEAALARCADPYIKDCLTAALAHQSAITSELHRRVSESAVEVLLSNRTAPLGNGVQGWVLATSCRSEFIDAATRGGSVSNPRAN
jgi:hypothetical protein